MSVWETRVQDYATYAAANPGVDHRWQDCEYDGIKQAPDHPVVYVSWKDANAFCTWLSQKEGLIYRLPTDHEWSMAVGIGDRENSTANPLEKDGKILGIYPWGTTWPPPPGAGNYDAGLIDGYTDLHSFTASVGSYTPNVMGLYDVGGNVWEWCEDSYSGELPNYRVLRGGGWNSWANLTGTRLLSAYRDSVDGGLRWNNSGFRVVRVIGKN